MSSSPTQRPRRPLRWLLLILLLVVLAGVAYHLLLAPADKATPPARAGAPATAVSAVSASRGDLPLRLSALGTVRPLRSVDIRTRVEGELTEVDFNEGDRVEKGELLARIDPRDYQAALAQAQGQLRQNQAQLASAQEDLARYQKLISTNYVSRQELEQQRQLVRQYEGSVAADQAAVDSAQVQLDYTRITAPFSGVVGIRNVDPGNIVQLGDSDPIVTLTQLDPISVIFSLPSRYVDTVRARLAAGEHPAVSVTGPDGQTVNGQLTSVDSRIDSATGTIRLRATLDNPSGGLYPNAYVDVSLISQTLRDRVIVPEPAIQTGQNGDYVYVVNADDSVSRREVEVSASEDHQSAIASGLDAGERVVVDGVDSLRDGAKVRVVSDALPGESTDDSGSASADEPGGNNAGDSGGDSGEDSGGDGAETSATQGAASAAPAGGADGSAS
ncbi:efflux RND transporter periplasmic adaptor subunit [Salinicola sp. DM10]|uniref:efflux RND transporter periplasmic adaptor subunit n=1 Tax=Salinicola sp. DM10 TaxID=2815721 RepID=UPI001A8EE931|nr:efflux RND transporter periplasmic adaptor subunit [Salinicola sp. DM10]MCE3026044.1 efflux RND transporter periplasmic adaptor subunit [Salinicola sp. DM10]